MRSLLFGEVLFDVFNDKACIGGAPLNAAAHLAAQGVESYLLSALGQDELADMALREVAALGVHTDYIIRRSDRPTGQCLVTLDEKGMPSYNLLEDVAYDCIDAVPSVFERSFDLFGFGTLALRSAHNRQNVETVLEKGRFGDVYVDLNLRAPYYTEETVLFALSKTTMLKLSDEEWPVVSRLLFGEERTPREGLPGLCAAYPGLKLVLLTCGEKGACAFEASSGRLKQVAATPCTVVSTVGAGDSFGAAFLARYFAGDPVERCLQTAADVSAFVVSRPGAVPDDLKLFLQTKLPCIQRR